MRRLIRSSVIRPEWIDARVDARCEITATISKPRTVFGRCREHACTWDGSRACVLIMSGVSGDLEVWTTSSQQANNGHGATAHTRVLPRQIQALDETRSRTGRLPRWRWLIFLPSSIPSFVDPMLIDAPADSFRRSAIQHERIETRWWLIAILTGATSKDGSSSFLWASRRAGRSWPLPICPTRHELFHNNECATVCHRDSSLLLFY
jgi:hypothetical protein